MQKSYRIQNQNITARIPHQSPIGSEEPIGDSFPPGEAMGAAAPDEPLFVHYGDHIL